MIPLVCASLADGCSTRFSASRCFSYHWLLTISVFPGTRGYCLHAIFFLFFYYGELFSVFNVAVLVKIMGAIVYSRFLVVTI